MYLRKTLCGHGVAMRNRSLRTFSANFWGLRSKTCHAATSADNPGPAEFDTVMPTYVHPIIQIDSSSSGAFAFRGFGDATVRSSGRLTNGKKALGAPDASQSKCYIQTYIY